jgi:uncharacterized DUF497 family protein
MCTNGFGVARRPHCAYNLPVHITYDAAKNERNIRRRGLSFDRAADFEFESARIHIDKRKDYGETRYIALGRLDGRVHVLCFCETEDGIRIISFRKANSREVKRYEKVEAAG